MSKIYSYASKVVVLLGPEDNNSKLAMIGIADGEERGTTFEKAIKALFQREYWKRLWGIQEIMLAQSVVVQCDGTSFDWPRLEEYFHTPTTLRALSGAFHCVLDKGSDGSATTPAEAIVRVRDSIDENVKLSYIITTFADWQCSNPRDKAYGLLGLVKEERGVVVDYGRPTDEVFRDVV
jgi:hypothetical protein